jgi:hypothetical protein
LTQRLAVRPPPRAVQLPPGAAPVRATYCCGLRWLRPSSSSHHRHVPSCMHCYSAVRTPSTGARHTVVTSRCFGRRTASPHRRQAGTSNLLTHDDVRAMKAAGSIGYAVNQGHCPRWSRDRSPRGRRGQRQQKTLKIEKNLNSDYHVGRIDYV